MPFGRNTTAVLVIIAAIIIVTVANNLIAAARSDEAAAERKKQLETAISSQQEIQRFEHEHRYQTQGILDELTAGVDKQRDVVVTNQERIIDKLDQILQTLNQSSSSNSSSSGPTS